MKDKIEKLIISFIIKGVPIIPYDEHIKGLAEAIEKMLEQEIREITDWYKEKIESLENKIKLYAEMNCIDCKLNLRKSGNRNMCFQGVRPEVSDYSAANIMCRFWEHYIEEVKDDK